VARWNCTRANSNLSMHSSTHSSLDSSIEEGVSRHGQDSKSVV
jgi:hypothetical protein